LTNNSMRLRKASLFFVTVYLHEYSSWNGWEISEKTSRWYIYRYW
jgi:hypothetical protein